MILKFMLQKAWWAFVQDDVKRALIKHQEIKF